MRDKTCRQCNQTKPLEAFYRCSRNKDGRAYQCIECRKRYLARSKELRSVSMAAWRAANRDVVRKNFADSRPIVRERALNQYGLTGDGFRKLLDAQGGVCAICGGQQIIAGRRLAVDHDHSTGAVRGLLCNRCNMALGLFKDDAATILKAVDYLSGVTC